MEKTASVEPLWETDADFLDSFCQENNIFQFHEALAYQLYRQKRIGTLLLIGVAVSIVVLFGFALLMRFGGM